MNITAENTRFHAAGHIAAALLLVQSGQAVAAQTVIAAIQAYVNHEKVDAPPQLKAKVAGVLAVPNSDDLTLLERWFVDPLNTIIEKSGA